jgi:hypothetical protein
MFGQTIIFCVPSLDTLKPFGLQVWINCTELLDNMLVLYSKNIYSTNTIPSPNCNEDFKNWPLACPALPES